MLEGKFEKLEFQKMLTSPYRKNKSEEEQNKNEEKGTKRNRESKKENEKKERWIQGLRKMIPHVLIKMILGLITLKHSLGLSILSFGTINPGLRYIPEKSILIEHGYLDWRGFSLENFHLKIILINHSSIWDELWIFKCIMGQSKKKMKNEKKNATLGWKPERMV